jgi:hypothetical protein
MEASRGGGSRGNSEGEGEKRETSSTEPLILIITLQVSPLPPSSFSAPPFSTLSSASSLLIPYPSFCILLDEWLLTHLGGEQFRER